MKSDRLRALNAVAVDCSRLLILQERFIPPLFLLLILWQFKRQEGGGAAALDEDGDGAGAGEFVQQLLKL